MARPKKGPIRSDGTYEYKATVGKTLDGKLIRKSFYSGISVADAKAKAEEYKVKQAVINTVGVTAETASDITFEVWAQKWLTVYKKPHVTENTYRLTYLNSVEKHLIPYFGKAELKNIRSIDVQNFFVTKQNDLSESMLDKLHMCLFGIFETAIDNDLIYKNPVKNTTYTSNVPARTKTVWSEAEIKLATPFLKAQFPQGWVLLETGLRRGELLGLMWSDVDIDNKTLSVNRSIAEKKGGGVEIRPPKWNSYRTIPISQELVDLLRELPRDTLYVFPNILNSIQLPSTFSKNLALAMKKLNKQHSLVPKLTAHELRHTRGTQLRRDGVDIYTIQKLMGHKDINVTANIYVHDEVEATRKAAKIV